LARIYGQDSPQAAALHEVLQAPHPGWDPAALGLLRGVDNAGQFAVGDPAVLRRLLGRQLQVSATVAERYYECRFAYYMERVLKALPRRKADISPLESGTFVHYILEKVIGEAKDDFASQSDAQLAEMAGRHADAFIAEQLVDDTRRNRWRLAQIKQTTLELLLILRDYAAKSGFTIDALELDIGADGAGVPPLEIEAGGVCLRVSGKVDRVDTWQKEGKTYLCIMDYKTGDKRFSLDEVYNGINMQMIIYMDVLCKNISNQYQNPTPGAILYLTGDPSPKSGARQGAEGPVFKFDGLLLNDGDVLRAMAASGDGMLPVRYNRDGSLRSGSKVADEALFENLQQHAEKMLAAMAGNVMGGHFPAQPLVRHGQRPCAYCPYRAACRHEDGVNEREMQPRPENAFADADAPGEGGAHRG
jgi:ATP-dependent helicase/nuclease subunit B